MHKLHQIRYHRTVDEISTDTAWPESMLHNYGQMLTVGEVAHILNLGQRNVRDLLTTTDEHVRLPGVKIGKSWRISRAQLSAYLRSHHNEEVARTAASDLKGS